MLSLDSPHCDKLPSMDDDSDESYDDSEYQVQSPFDLWTCLSSIHMLIFCGGNSRQNSTVVIFHVESIVGCGLLQAE